MWTIVVLGGCLGLPPGGSIRYGILEEVSVGNLLLTLGGTGAESVKVPVGTVFCNSAAIIKMVLILRDIPKHLMMNNVERLENNAWKEL